MKDRIDSLDSLRGISAMIVIIFHCLLCFALFENAKLNAVYDSNLVEWLSVTPLHTLWAGSEAVILFFILSGFVLAIPFLNNRVLNYKDYAIKRVFRIYIPYIIIMMISVAFVSFFADYKEMGSLTKTYEYRWDHDVSLRAIISYFLMIPFDLTNVNGVVWSLIHEMRISLIFPLFMIIIIKYDWKKALLFGFVVLIFLRNFFKFAAINISSDYLSLIVSSFGATFYYALFFFMGSLLSKYRKQIIDKVRLTSNISKVILFIISLLLINYEWMFYFYKFKGTILVDFVPAIGILILFIVVLSSNFANSILTIKPLLWLGKISYSLYLTHIITLMMLTIFIGKIAPVEVAFILTPIVSLPVAYLSYKYIEVPAIEWGKKTIKWLNSRKDRENKVLKSQEVGKKNL